jgi:replicative DNA helicase
VLKIPIIVAAQTNRSGAREGAALDNVGGGLSIVQDADIVVGMNQDDEMKEEKTMELRLQKNRGGPLLTFNAIWDHDTLTYREEGLKDRFRRRREGRDGDE